MPTTTDDDLVLPEGTRLLHIGPHKTGTTALQGALWTARDAMQQQGVRQVGESRNPANAVRAVTGQPSPFSETEPPPISHWQALVREIRAAREPRLVVSSEFFAWADEAAIRRIVDDVGGDAVRVAVTLRPLARILPSMWQQNVQAGQVNAFETWLEAVFRRPRHPFWTLHQHDRLIARWAGVVGVERVTAIVVDDRDHEALPRSFERLLGLRAGTLAMVDDFANRSLTMPEVEAVRAFNAAFRAEGLTRAVHARMMRFGAAQEMKRRQPGTDEPRVELPAWADDRVTAMAGEVIEGIASSGVRVVGDLDALRWVPQRASEPAPAVTAIPPEVAASMAMGILVVSGRAREDAVGWAGLRVSEPRELARIRSRHLVGYVVLRAWRSLANRLGRLQARKRGDR
jgi:hypothetical protein